MVYLFTRHFGAVEWVNSLGIRVDAVCQSFEDKGLSRGDIVIGNLPLHIVESLTAKGVLYLHIVLEVPFAMRGKELSCEDLLNLGARLRAFEVWEKDFNIADICSFV